MIVFSIPYIVSYRISNTKIGMPFEIYVLHRISYTMMRLTKISSKLCSKKMKIIQISIFNGNKDHKFGETKISINQNRIYLSKNLK